MDPSEKTFWWCLEFTSMQEFEDNLYWKLEDLGINRFAMKFSPENEIKRTFLIWLPSFEWSKDERNRLGNILIAFAESLEVEISSFHWEKIENQDWSQSWKQEWHPDPVGTRLLILPAWLEPPKEYSQRIILRIDPGSAFGTGSHPTTRLCLETLEEKPPSNLKVVDLGCGSGILSLAALGLGAKEVLAVDTDSLAVRSTLQNFRINCNIEGTYRVHLGSVTAIKEQLKGDKVDLIVCNILASIIEELAPSFNDLVPFGGSAILSGILNNQVYRLLRIFESLGWDVKNIREKNNWALLEIARK